MRSNLIVVFALSMLAGSGTLSADESSLPPSLRKVAFDQRLNEQVPLDLQFKDEFGRAVSLSDYFGRSKPVILVLGYFRCPMLCTEVSNGLIRAMLDINLNVGTDFDVIHVSFDPREISEMALDKKKTYLERYGRAGAEAGWHFLTGQQEAIDRLTRAVGFRYSYDAKHDQFAHASGIIVLTPEGKIARYFYDVHFVPRDLRLGLVEASANKIGSPVDQILLFCFHYDPQEGRYGVTIMNLVRLGGVLTVAGIALLMYFLWRGDRRRARRLAKAEGEDMFAQMVWFPPQASTTAQSVDWLLYFLLVVCGSVGLVVGTLVIYFCIRFRRRPDTVNPAEMRGNNRLELLWSATPLGIFMIIFVWGAIVYFSAYRAPDHATVVYVVGKQWMWKMQHPEGQREINELHVPIGQPCKLLLTSEDVIHSFFVPAFRVHMDVLPGRYTSVWFQPSQIGTYHLFCSQYCGTNHSGMIGRVVVMEPSEYQRWLNEHAEGSLALQGRKTFLKYRCLSCHSADSKARAPVLEELYGSSVHLQDGHTVIADEDYLRESIVAPGAKIVAGWRNIMPTFQGQVQPEEINELIAFIKALKKGETPRRVEAFPPPVTTPPINPLKE